MFCAAAIWHARELSIRQHIMVVPVSYVLYILASPFVRDGDTIMLITYQFNRQKMITGYQLN